MGNHHSASHAPNKPRKNVHWKSAGRPAAPGKPEIIPLLSEDEPNAITLRWGPGAHDGGAPLRGYQVECNRLGSADWLRTAPPLVLRPELVLSGLAPPHRYQFRVAALNAVGRSDYSPISDVLTVTPDRPAHEPPVFLQFLQDITALENDKTEYRVTFTGTPAPTIAWFKDDYEIFSSRRTAITTDETSSVLVFHQTLSSDEGEIKCTATNRGGHAVTKARLSLEAAPKLRYPRQYEDGLLYEINETVFLKTTIVGKPTPSVEWYHDGQAIVCDDRVEVSNTPKFSVLKIHTARRSDRGEYQIHARNTIGEDMAAFLVTITAPPDPPRRVSVSRQVDKSVTLAWEPPEDDGGCRIGNYVVEYYRSGWNVWLKATTSRKTNVTLFDLIEGSEYRFRVKAESPYGMSAPSVESAPVRVPGRAVDMEFLAVESRIINEALVRDGEALAREGEVPAEGAPVSPAPRRKRAQQQQAQHAAPTQRLPSQSQSKDPMGSGEFMLVLYPEHSKSVDKTEKRHSLQLDPDVLSPPPLSLSSPELSTRNLAPFRPLRNAVSSTELLHERAMARVFKAVAMQEEQEKTKLEHIDIPPSNDQRHANEQPTKAPEKLVEKSKPPEIIIKSDSVEDTEYKYNSRQMSQDSVSSEGRWQQMSFDEDYTASTVSSDEEYSDEGSLNGEMDRRGQYSNDEDTYNPRDKLSRASHSREDIEEEEEPMEPVKPLPLPDPNFVPKPILKRREPVNDVLEPTIAAQNNTLKPDGITKTDQKSKKEKMTILKKITKMPVQKPFSFPKLLSKRGVEKIEDLNLSNEKHKLPDKKEKFQDKISDEGRTVIDYYGNIVKEYGSHKRPVTPIYLNVDDLKTVAEQQQLQEKQEEIEDKIVTKPKKPVSNKSTNNKAIANKTKIANSIEKTVKPKEITNSDKVVASKKVKELPPKAQKAQNKEKKSTQQVILKKTERATIVIPIDYQELEEKAKIKVRSAIDYTVDVCLLLLAFWVYLFKDERLAIPFLILIIYRQLQETILFNIPEWARRHTPSWTKKTS